MLDDGCLVIGDYKITFKSDGSVNENEKGNCQDYEISVSEQSGSNSGSKSVEDTCSGPNCVYTYYTDEYAIEGSFAASNTPIEFSNTIYTTKDYTTLKDGALQRNYFLGHILTNGKIQKSYACGIENNTLFCL